MMDVAAIRECIGAKRFVWIDDEFGNTPTQLGRMLIENRETALACGFENEINEILATADADVEGAHGDLVQHLADRDRTSLPAIRRRFFEVKNDRQGVAKELDASTVGAVCDLLEVAEDDRRHFDDAEAVVASLANDEGVCFVIDLVDVATRQRRGLDVLRRLAETDAKGVAFILTHETTTTNEATFEARLGRELDDENGRHVDLPICVIAKERLYNSSEPAAVHDQLAIALKRAGLRKCMHEVLRIAGSHVDAEFADAARNLLLVPPETLDAFAIERAYTEGLSELHVVERALSSRMSKGLRHLFGTDGEIRRRADRMRRLRDVRLEAPASAADPVLAAFQQDEIYEGEELINAGLTPIACGDVFETYKEPDLPKVANRRFLLVGQPCDIALRAEGKRDQDAAYLIPIRTISYETAAAEKAKLKEHHLPFAINGEVWVCDLRAAASARLGVLDLASLRPDGLVRANDGQAANPGLLPGLRAIHDSVRKPAIGAIAAADRIQAKQKKAEAEAAVQKGAEETEKMTTAATLATIEATFGGSVAVGGAEASSGAIAPSDDQVPADGVPFDGTTPAGEMHPTDTSAPAQAGSVATGDAQAASPRLVDPDLLLTLADEKRFRPIRVGQVVPAKKKTPGYVTWQLKRTGRIQMPFATAILDALTGVLTRRAYELDFARPRSRQAAPHPNKGAPAADIAARQAAPPSSEEHGA